jgi:hypothetical protein
VGCPMLFPPWEASQPCWASASLLPHRPHRFPSEDALCWQEARGLNGACLLPFVPEVLVTEGTLGNRGFERHQEEYACWDK